MSDGVHTPAAHTFYSLYEGRRERKSLIKMEYIVVILWHSNTIVMLPP